MKEVLESKGEEENKSTVVHGEVEEEENESGGILGLKRKEEREKATYSTASLPLGFVFWPTDEQLISHYLRLKNEGRHFDVQIFAEVDLFNCNPYDLPELSVIKSDGSRWYFFSPEKKLCDKRLKARLGGYWKEAGKARSIRSSKGLIGDCRTYVWYLYPSRRLTDWILRCYRATDEAGTTRQNAFILCVLSKRCGVTPPAPVLSGRASDGLPIDKKWKDDEAVSSLTVEPSMLLRSKGSSGGKKNEVDEIGAEPRTSDVGLKSFSSAMDTFPDTINQHQVPQSFRMWAGLGLAEPPQDEPWDRAKEILLMDNELSVLPEYPTCPRLSTLFLQRNYKLRTIPQFFFYYMPSLQILNLSRTGIKSLPESIIQLVSLKRLFLNNCHNFMVLSPKVGELKQLEVLDLEGTDIKYLPWELKKLTNLKCLEVSLYGYGRRIVQPFPVLPHGVISALSHLEELNIKVNVDDNRWNSCVEDVVTEVCTLGHLNSLKFYFPRMELLGKVLSSSAIWKFPSLSEFKFTVGHHVERIMSRLPRDVEFELERWERCLKYINGYAIAIDIKKVLQYSTAFFLERHATVKNLSDFGIGNMQQLKCCVVGECNEVEFIIDEANAQGEDSEADSQEEGNEANVHEEGDLVDAYKEHDEVDACEEDDDLDANEDGEELNACAEDDNNEIEPKTSRAKTVVLGSLEYLFVYYMKNLKKLWKGPVQPRSLSLLKSLTLRTCPQLTTIFTKILLDNLYNLEELSVEDCPSVTTLVSCEIFVDNKVSYSLPNLKRILLHYLPGLVGFSTGLLTAPKIEWLSFYNCPNLKRLLIEEVCSQNLKRIKGERSWWEALEWRSGRPASLDDIFVPVKEPPSLYQ